MVSLKPIFREENGSTSDRLKLLAIAFFLRAAISHARGFSFLTKKLSATYLMMAALLMFALPLFATPSLAQSSASQNLLRNGDFSNGLTGWTPGVLRPSAYAGYPKWGTISPNAIHGKGGATGLSAYLDVAGGAAAYLESDPFMLPNTRGDWRLNFTIWGIASPTILQVQIKTQMGIYTLDNLEPPKILLDQQPVLKQYLIPANFTSHDIALRFTCSDTPPNHALWVFCSFGNLVVIPPPPPPDVNPVTFVFVAMGVATAAVGVALALHASSSAQGGSKFGFHAYLASLALAIAAVLSRKFCCACAGACNHTGPHSFCPAHDPRTLYSRMQIVYTTYCRHCGRKLEDHECREPVVKA
jgi:hypothetical protein